MSNKLIQNKILNTTLNVIGFGCGIVWKIGSFNYKKLLYDMFDEEGKFCIAVTKWSKIFVMVIAIMIIVRAAYGLMIKF